MDEKMIVKTVDGQEFTFSGKGMEEIKKYFQNPFNYAQIDWIVGEQVTVNIAHVVSVHFVEKRR